MKIITKYAPSAIKDESIINYKNKTLAIDANLLINKNIFAVRKHGYDIKNNNIIITHLHTLLSQLSAFKKYNITPIFVFDGKYPLLKTKTMSDRKEYTKKMKKIYDDAENNSDEDTKKKYFYRKAGISGTEINDCKDLLKLLGYTVIDAKYEADTVCAYLSIINKVDAVVTNDFDILLLGGTKILKNFSIDSKKTFQTINLKKILSALKFNQGQLIELGILLGTDYNVINTTFNIGILSAYTKLKQYTSIKNLIKQNIINIDFDYDIIKKYFSMLLKKINSDTLVNKIYNSNKNPVDAVNLKIFLERFQYNKEKIKSILDLFI